MPTRAIVQSNLIGPKPLPYIDLANMMYTQHAMASNVGVDCGAVFGGDPAPCSGMQQAIHKLFALPAPSAVEAVEQCRLFGIDYLVVTKFDPAWQDRQGWVWTLQAVGKPTRASPNWVQDSQETVRTVNCGANLTTTD